MCAKNHSRFQSDPGKYAAYLDTPEGRLRLDLAFGNLQEFLPARSTVETLRAVDLGCGTGAAGIRLARLGIHVTLLDSSSAMLELAKRAVDEAGMGGQVTIKHGDVTGLSDLSSDASFDVMVCHNVLEYVDDPVAVLRDAVRLLRGRSAILSVLVRNQAGEVMKSALQTGDLSAAERNLSAEWVQESLYGGEVRLFTTNAMEGMLAQASLNLISQRGVRVVADYLPSRVSRTAEYAHILDLERMLGRRPEFVSMARYTQWLACPATSSSRSGK
jgi:S-adenosylmethionine-dependent methyltransferase